MSKHRTPHPLRRRAAVVAALMAPAALVFAGTATADDEQTCTGQVACVDEVVEVGDPQVIGDVGFEFHFGS